MVISLRSNLMYDFYNFDELESAIIWSDDLETHPASMIFNEV